MTVVKVHNTRSNKLPVYNLSTTRNTCTLVIVIVPGINLPLFKLRAVIGQESLDFWNIGSFKLK